MIVKLFSFDKMINFTFSLRIGLVGLLILYVPAYFFFYKPSHVRTATNVAILCLFVRWAWLLIATRPSHVLQTAFRCAEKFLQIISVKISEEVFIFS